MITVLMGDAARLGLRMVVRECDDLRPGEVRTEENTIFVGRPETEEDLRACWWNSLAEAYPVLVENGFEKITVGLPVFGKGQFPARESARLGQLMIRKLHGRYPETKDMDLVIGADGPDTYKSLKAVFR